MNPGVIQHTSLQYLADPAIQLAVALAFTLLFALSAIHKLRNQHEFTAILTNYRLLPLPLLRTGALLIPLLEIAASVALVFPATRADAALLVSLLLLAYGAAMAINLLRGNTQLDCGCHMGDSIQTVSWALVIRNCAMATMPLVFLVETNGREMTALDGVVVAFVVAIASITYNTINTLVQQQQGLRRLFS